MEINAKDLICLIDKYIELTKLEICDIRVIETLVQVIMCYVHIRFTDDLQEIAKYYETLKKHS